MKFWEIVRFEVGYQSRRVSTWLFFVILLVLAFLFVRGNYIDDARNGAFLLNAPWVITMIAVLGSMLSWLLAAPLAGNAAARDVRTGMYALIYAAPVRKFEYLGGRFLAAFLLNAFILLALPIGTLLGMHLPGVEAELLGPFRPAAYITAYIFIALPNALFGAAVQFSVAAATRRVMTSYAGSVLLTVIARAVAPIIAVVFGWRGVARMVDPTGVFIVSRLLKSQTPVETNTHLIGLSGALLANRLIWIGIALGIFAITLHRFRFTHVTARTWWGRIKRGRDSASPRPAEIDITRINAISIPQVPRVFGLATHARQTLAVAWESFRTIAGSKGGFILPVAITVVAGLYAFGHLTFMGVPLIPRTDHIITFLTAPLTNPQTAWILIPLLTVFYAGELVWRDREIGLSEIADAAPVPEWVLLLGKFVGLSLVLAGWMALLVIAAVVVQAGVGYDRFDITAYLQTIMGLQLAEYLLFAFLALVINGLVGEKYVGYLVSLLAYGVIAFASMLGIHHHLLVYGASPDWSFTDMRGFGATLAPWLWFKFYWVAWALLLAVVASVFWVRGTEPTLRAQLRNARRRLTRPTLMTAAVAVSLILAIGGFIFYNTNVLNAYTTAAEKSEQRAAYERLYKSFEDMPQATLTATRLNVALYPENQAADINSTYHLVNRTGVPVDSIQLTTNPDVETRDLQFDRPAMCVLADDDLGFYVYSLRNPLLPGDSLQLGFNVHIQPRGFRNDGVDGSIVANGTFFWNYDYLPAIGYQVRRELRSLGQRRAHGLAARPGLPSLADYEAGPDTVNANLVTLDAVVSTDTNQVAVAPGSLRRTWTDGGRRYFHYVTDVPIGDEYAFFSANYANREATWHDVAIQIFHDPRHAGNVDRMIHSVQASLSHYTEQFGPYPFDHVRIVERPGLWYGLHAEANTIDYQEGFTLLNPEDGPWALDLPFYVVAHEVAHQWWGFQLAPAPVEGAGLLVESLASFSAYQVVEHTYGPAQLHRIFGQLRKSFEEPRSRAAPPLIQVADAFQFYRRGPFSLFALSRYLGEDRVNSALRRLLEAHRVGAGALATSLDLYHELEAVTPDSLQYLLHDLFAANTWWEFKTMRATASEMDSGSWQVTLDVRARKVVVDSMGAETELPMDDWIQVGVFAQGEPDDELGKPLEVQMRRVRSGEQTITVSVPQEPVLAGIDPYHLLDWEKGDKVARVKIAE